MKKNLAALISGIIFGLGLSMSGMINPRVVLSFLDIFGRWDPTLGFVMVGGLAVTVPAYRVIFRRNKPVCAERFSLPDKKHIDGPLTAGSVLFGIGWGLAGICPGPAITVLAFGVPLTFVFLAAMLAGMKLHCFFQKT